jgi:hypothetical protein
MAVATESKTAAAEGLLRRLSVAVKAVSLYPPPHPVADRAIAEFHARLMIFAESHGPFVVRVSKKALTVDGTVFGEGSHQALAFALYTRRVATFAIMPMTGIEELAAFVCAVGRDRKSLDAAGGVSHLLWEAGVEHVQVVEVSVRSESPAAGGGVPLDVSEMARLDIGRRLSPQERERVLDVLRAGPQEAGQLLENLSAPPVEDARPEAQADRVYRTLQHLDRLILDQPAEEQAELTARLAGATLQLAEPVRATLDTTLLVRAPEDVTADLIVGHFSIERLAHAVINAVTQDKAAEQIAALLAGARVHQEKARAVLSILDERLRPAGAEPQWLVRAVWPMLQTGPPQPAPGIILDGDLDYEQMAVSDQELASRLEEIRDADDAAVTREVIRTLADVLLADDERQELLDAAGFLEAHVPWLLDRDEFGVLADVLRALRTLSASPAEAQREVAARLKQAVAADRVVERLVTRLWAGRGTPLEQEIQTCLALAGDALIGPLVGILGQEAEAGKRLMLCDLLVAIGRPHVEALARSLGDPRAELVSSIVNVLGRLANPEAVPHLARVRRHSDYTVRRDVTDALARIGTDDAQTVLARCLDDPDPRIRVRTLGALNTTGVREAAAFIQQVLGPNDWLGRQFEVRHAALAAAERFGDLALLPVVHRTARRRLCIGGRAREIRRLGGLAEAAIRVRHPRLPVPVSGGGRTLQS